MTDEPTYTPPAPYPESGYVQFQIPGLAYSVVRVPLVWNIEQFNVLVASAMESAKLVKEAHDEAFPERVMVNPEPQYVPVQRPPFQPPSQPGGQQQRETRDSKYPVLDGWACDNCGGPVGRRAATGRMRSDAAVCLGRCKDGQYVHTVSWLDA